MSTGNASRFAALYLLCFVTACQRRETIVEFSLDTSPPTFIGGATCEYRPTTIEKRFYDRLSEAARITLQTKPDEFPDESHAFKLHGHEGEFISWWGIVRDIKRSPNLRSAMLLIENKYFDGSTDCYLFESISICGGGDFEAELTDIPDDLIPLVLVRVYGAVTRQENNRPIIKADYVRVWHEGQFAFFSYGDDRGNPEWKKNLKLPPDENPYILMRKDHYYRDHLGPTADQLEILKRYYRKQTIIQFADIPFQDWTPTAGYAPTEIEKQLFLSRMNVDDYRTVQSKSDETIQSQFRLRGHVGQFVSWFGIVRDVVSTIGKRGGRLLIENKYSNGITDDHPQIVSINGGGDFRANVTNLAEDLPLTLVRVYGTVVGEERLGPVVQAEYIRVWRWGEFKFNDYGDDHSNPYWRRSVKLQPDDFSPHKQLSAEYYVRLLGTTAEETSKVKKFFEWLKPDRKPDNPPPQELGLNPSATP